MIHSFLLIGQSNMAGRGLAGSVPTITHENIKMLRNGRWQPMAEPIHNDRPTAGIGLASSFAACWQANNQPDQIGLIPCADGGTSLDDWQVGGELFDHAVFQAKLAKRNSQLAGILWHQGENDCASNLAAQYVEKFAAIIKALRKQLDEPTIPLIVGALGDFLPTGEYGAHFLEYQRVNQALQKYTAVHPNSYFVSAEDLTANDDQIHFNGPSLRRFGSRYYHAFVNKTSINEPLASENQLLEKLYSANT